MQHSPVQLLLFHLSTLVCALGQRRLGRGALPAPLPAQPLLPAHDRRGLIEASLGQEGLPRRRPVRLSRARLPHRHRPLDRGLAPVVGIIDLRLQPREPIQPILLLAPLALPLLLLVLVALRGENLSLQLAEVHQQRLQPREVDLAVAGHVAAQVG